jgi:serine/threonine-protein kinase
MSKVFTITEGLENMGALKTGGQGSVYKAKRTGTIITAVKLLPTPILSEDPADKNFTDFQNEVQKLKRVNEEPNPNVVTILSSGITETGSFPFIEMEFIEGPDLEELLRPPHDPVFKLKEAIKLAEHLAHALEHCHKADIKHGDIKSNNVKFNIRTGNYVLLDFGLAIMSDEQRRTSLRHAGAIEFMAPEQGNGETLFQTDVYSFGVIIFELLAGQVPFPLKDRSETARNQTMVAHMETPPPDMLALRRQNLPSSWTDEQREREMNVPQWLVALVYRCLDKNPQSRFANGTELHQYVLYNSTSATAIEGGKEAELSRLLDENRLLKEENEKLQHQALANAYSLRDSRTTSVPPPVQRVTPKKKSSGLLLAAVIIGGLIGGFFLVKSLQDDGEPSTDSTSTVTTISKKELGQYKVVASRAYFHNKPDPATRRAAYLIPSNEVIKALDEQGGFIYTEFTNSSGESSKGWILKKDLLPLAEWQKKNKDTDVKLTIEDIRDQLKDARALLSKGKLDEALSIYDYLTLQNVPEAMYYSSTLALQEQNDKLSCDEALKMLSSAAEQGYTPAKKTFGFLLLFADDPDRLSAEKYGRCDIPENVSKGTALLVDASLEGDPDAQRLLDEFNSRDQDL